MTTKYVDSAATGTGTGDSEANAYTTIDAAMNWVTGAGAGPHKIYIKAGSYNERATVDTAGTTTAPVVVEGYTTTPGDGGTATIDGGGVSDAGFSGGSAALYYVFKNLRVTGSTGEGWSMSASDRMTFINCQADDNDGSGFHVDRGCRFYKCTAFSNGVDGFDHNQTTVFVSCVSYSNTFVGFDGTYGIHINCVAYNNPTAGARSAGVGDFPAVFVNCTIDQDNSGDCIASVDENTTVVNCILYDAGTGGFGVDFDAAHDELPIVAHNLVNSNTGGDYSNSVTSIEGDVTSAPSFTDEAGDDYTLGGSSPALDAGIDGSQA